MTNNPLPAALASIKRYGPTMILFDDGWKAGMSEKKNGEFYPVDDIAQLFATLPPPADGAVTDEMVGRALYAAARFVDPGFTSRDRMRAALIAAYAAPPADSAMERIKELEQALEPFAKFCSSEEKIALVVNTAYVRAARKALAWDARTLLAGRE
jgi:hypothetical protein